MEALGALAAKERLEIRDLWGLVVLKGEMGLAYQDHEEDQVPLDSQERKATKEHKDSPVLWELMVPRVTGEKEDLKVGILTSFIK